MGVELAHPYYRAGGLHPVAIPLKMSISLKFFSLFNSRGKAVYVRLDVHTYVA